MAQVTLSFNDQQRDFVLSVPVVLAYVGLWVLVPKGGTLSEADVSRAHSVELQGTAASRDLQTPGA